jgi:hypothetical protein
MGAVVRVASSIAIGVSGNIVIKVASSAVIGVVSNRNIASLSKIKLS